MEFAALVIHESRATIGWDNPIETSFNHPWVNRVTSPVESLRQLMLDCMSQHVVSSLGTAMMQLVVAPV
jgi:hypothetical protein